MGFAIGEEGFEVLWSCKALTAMTQVQAIPHLFGVLSPLGLRV